MNQSIEKEIFIFIDDETLISEDIETLEEIL